MTQDEAKAVLKYDKLTGVFTRLKTSKNGAPVGSVAGYKTKTGHIRIGILSKFFFAHRLAWFYVYGVWPSKNIDHINGDASDNRIENLRDVSQRENTQNRKGPTAKNKSGYLGVYWNKKDRRWRASINANGTKKYIGSFSTPQEAHSAYLSAKRAMHPGCTI